jgi:hypothetical protein
LVTLKTRIKNIKDKIIKIELLPIFQNIVISTLYAYTCWQIIQIDPYDTKSQVSSALKMQLLYILILVIFVFLKINTDNFVTKFLNFSISLNIGYVTASYILALSGAPLFTPISGDYKAQMIMAIQYQDQYLFNETVSSYPPLWFILQAFIANNLHLSTLSLNKYLNLIFPIIFGNLYLAINQKLFGKFMGSFLAIPFIFNLIVWREFATLTSIPLIIYSFIYLSKFNKNNVKVKNDKFKTFFLGLSIGLVFSFYYGNLYFILLGIFAQLFYFSINFKNQNFFIKMYDMGIGFYISFGIFVISPLFKLDFLEFILSIVGFIIFRLLLSIRINYIYYTLRMIFIIGLVLILFEIYSIDIGDKYFYEGISENLIFNPKINTYHNLLLTIFLLYYSVDFLMKNKVYGKIVQIIFIFFISAILTKYISGILLDSTGEVNLFPRADNVIYLTWGLFINLLIIFTFYKFFKLKVGENLIEPKFNLINKFAFTFIIVSFCSYNLYSMQQKIWPTESETINQAHLVCSNYENDNIPLEFRIEFNNYILQKCK